MKKLILTSCFAILASISVATAQNYVFSNSLYIGSTGPDVVNLQTWLISKGFDIPAIVSGAASKGYFGIQTQNAVESYQQSVGLPVTGFFGPLTIAKINSGYSNPIPQPYPIPVPNPTPAPTPIPNPYPTPVAGAPVISGVTAPTTLTVNQASTWTVNARDPQNGYLSYSVNWGDTYSCQSGYACSASALVAPSFTQTSTFTHSYANAGTYTVTFTVRDSAGLSAQTSSTVNVTNNGVTTGPLRVISPNGGENWVIGTTQNITWTSNYYSGYSNYSSYPNVSTVDIKLVPYQQPCTGQQVCPMYILAPYTIATNVSANQDYYSWIVGNASNIYGNGGTSNITTIPAGQYTIQVCQSGTTNCDSSDGTFTVTNSSYYNPPYQNQCPAGYVCALNNPNPATVSCPVGYTCTPNTY